MKHLWFLKVFVITWFGFFGFEASADTWLDYAGNPQTRQGLTSVLRQLEDAYITPFQLEIKWGTELGPNRFRHGTVLISLNQRQRELLFTIFTMRAEDLPPQNAS